MINASVERRRRRRRRWSSLVVVGRRIKFSSVWRAVAIAAPSAAAKPWTTRSRRVFPSVRGLFSRGVQQTPLTSTRTPLWTFTPFPSVPRVTVNQRSSVRARNTRGGHANEYSSRASTSPRFRRGTRRNAARTARG